MKNYSFLNEFFGFGSNENKLLDEKAKLLRKQMLKNSQILHEHNLMTYKYYMSKNFKQLQQLSDRFCKWLHIRIKPVNDKSIKCMLFMFVPSDVRDYICTDFLDAMNGTVVAKYIKDDIQQFKQLLPIIQNCLKKSQNMYEDFEYEVLNSEAGDKRLIDFIKADYKRHGDKLFKNNNKY